MIAGRRFGLVVLLALLLPAAAPAQAIRGTLREEGSRAPIEGAMIVLLDEQGKRRTGTLTGADGGFLLFAPYGGRFEVRVERIGYRSPAGRWLRVPPDQVVEHDLTAPVAVVELDGIDVSAARRCEVRPAEGRAVQRVWEEARKALFVTRWTAEQQLFRYDVESFRRERSRDARRVLRDSTERSLREVSVPFVSLPPEELATGGYVRSDSGGVTFFAPDAHVLLSDAFLDGHCFRLRSGRGEASGLLGLTFEPTEVAGKPDVEGVLWLDRRTAELRHLEFRYTGLPVREPERFKGRVEFERHRGGAWYVGHWWIRWPSVPIGDGATAWQRRARSLTEVGAAVLAAAPVDPPTAR